MSAGLPATETAGPGRAVIVGAFALLVVLVGANFVAIRASNRELGPFWNAGLRFAAAAVLFLGLAVARRTPPPERSLLRDGVVYGLLSFAGFFGLLYLGLVDAPAGLGQVVLAIGPLLTFAMAVTVGLEVVRVRPVTGGMIALAGIAVMYGTETARGVPATAMLALVGAAASFAAGGIFLKRAGPADPFVRNAIATAVGAVVLLGISAAVGERWSLPRDPGTVAAVIYLIGPGTVGVFLLFLFLLRHLAATTVALQFVLAPVVGISLGAILLHEQLGPATLVGAGLVIGGLWIGAIHATE